MKDDKRQNYLSKQDAYMLIAAVIAQRSKDPNTQVGCVIVSNDDRILSIGYNGFPNGCSDDEFPWARDNACDLDNKYFWVCHSELNAILNYRGDTHNFIGSSIYVTLFPCHECAKAIIQAGISNVYYCSDKYEGTDDNIASKRMFDAAGVKYIKYKITPEGYKTFKEI